MILVIGFDCINVIVNYDFFLGMYLWYLNCCEVFIVIVDFGIFYGVLDLLKYGSYVVVNNRKEIW